jgi:hypothetical protein
MSPPPILLKPLTTEMLADLQAMYEASAGYFLAFTGAPAPPIQAANDYNQLLESEDRAIMAIWWEDERIIGSLDFRFHHPAAGVLWLGALILQDDAPGGRDEIGRWAMRILEEWLRIATDIAEIRTAVPLNAPELVRFWRALDFELAPELLRQPIAGKYIRFGVFRKFISPASDSSHEQKDMVIP